MLIRMKTTVVLCQRLPKIVDNKQDLIKQEIQLILTTKAQIHSVIQVFNSNLNIGRVILRTDLMLNKVMEKLTLVQIEL